MANYPGSVSSFGSVSAGNTIQPADVNDLRREVEAIEAGLLNGTARLNSSATSVVSLSVTGGQITFPAVQSASASANVLDDYEEGTWTPSVGGTATYTVQQGDYVKIGRKVWFSCHLTINAIGSGSTTIIAGLPFAISMASGNTSAAVCVSYWGSAASSLVFVSGLVNGTGVVLVGLTAAATSVASPAIFGNGTDIVMSGTYEAAS